MKYYSWDEKKNDILKKERGVSFEQVVYYIEKNHLLAIIRHPNKMKYANQKIYIVKIEHYVYLVPFVESGKKVFLKTIIPSRKATKKYLGDKK